MILKVKAANKAVCILLTLLFTLTPLTAYASDTESIPETQPAETEAADTETPPTDTDTSEAGYTGAGVVIAVIDEGFDINTSFFKLSESIPHKLTKNDIRNILPELHGEGTYINAKIPYAYDYANETSVMSSNGEHGTHVAGIIGANGSKYTGAAPHAQLLLMKVFGDNGSANEEDLAHAIEDAVKLGADVINVSIGILAGYADGSPFKDELIAAFETADKAGITVICAAGNGARTGSGSYYAGIYGITDPAADTPDSGTTAAPATLETVTAVGALVSPETLALSFTLLDKPEENAGSEKSDEESEEVKGTKIRCTDSSYTYVEPIGQNLADRHDGETLEYVRVGGVGKPEDFKALKVSLEGKLALIERGEIAFVEKLNNAAEYGAVGAIVFDNVDTDVYSLMQLEGAVIPGVFVSKADGKLLDEAEYKYVHFKAGEASTFANPYAGQPSAYTSWGVTPELTLKPDVSAVGDDVESVIPDGELAKISGTSQASAYVSGCAALWCEYLNSKGLTRGTDYDADYIRALMMNAADVNTSAETGVEYSPRAQGAGEVRAEDTGKVGLVITAKDGKAKLELGDKLGEKFKFGADITNITAEPIEAKISAVLLGEGVTAYKITEGTVVEATANPEEKSDKLPYFVTGDMQTFDAPITADGVNINRNAEAAEALTVNIEPGKTLNVEFEADISSLLTEEYGKLFEYGFFAEGYIYAEYGEENISSIPYIGYVGDWSSIPVFDGELYEENTFYRNTYLYTDVTFYDRRTLNLDLGQNIYKDDSELNPGFLAFSPNGDKCAESVNMSLDMLRSVKDAGYKITSPDGKTVYESGDREYIRKNYVDSSGMLTYSDIVLWGGRDQKNANYVYPDGIYKVTFYATPAYKGAKEQTLTFNLVLDTGMPTIENIEFVTEGDKTLLKLKVSDEFYLMGVSVYGMMYGDTTELNIDEAITTSAEPGISYELTYDITGCDDRYIYIDALDYAYNLITERIENVNYKAPEN